MTNHLPSPKPHLKRVKLLACKSSQPDFREDTSSFSAQVICNEGRERVQGPLFVYTLWAWTLISAIETIACLNETWGEDGGSP